MKKIELNKEELDNILKMYNDELLGTHTISLKIGISKHVVNRILKENGVIFGSSGR
jgi:DNA invertase Pin-like site-specific DNA recombinase